MVCHIKKKLKAIGETKSWFFCLAACVLLAACSRGSAGVSEHTGPEQQADASNAGRTLTYYLDQREVVSGVRAVQRGQYEALVNGCKQAGEKIVPLSAVDLAKLSTGRKQTWQAPGKVAKQTVAWILAGGVGTIKDPVCHFKLKQVSKLTIRYASGKTYHIDLTAGSGTVDRGPPVSFAKQTLSKQDLAALERSIEQEGTIKGPIRHVVGQPCQVWTHPDAQTAEPWKACFWTGGERWGFGPASGILLASKMLDGEDTLTTTTFLVGRLPNGGQIFDIPQNISIRDKDAHTSRGNGL